MSDRSKIEWCDATWNVVSGCTPVSAGCAHCYAKTLHDRRHKAYLAGAKLPDQYAKPFKQIQLHPERLEMPLHWIRPRRIFVNSTSDLFHEDVPFDFVDRIGEVISHCKILHTFIILTKRADRMFEYFSDRGNFAKNVWLGVSVENQDAANKRIPDLLRTPAAIRFVSCEPLLGLVTFDLVIRAGDGAYAYHALSGRHFPFTEEPLYGPKLDWVITGGESGPNARPMHPDWVRSLRDQCQGVGVPFFFKQWGEWGRLEDHRGLGWMFSDPRTGFFAENHPGDTEFIYRGLSSHGQHMLRVGKKAAGRLLDGVEWNEFPGVK